MNAYRLSFSLRLPSGWVRECTQIIAAPGATAAILQLHALPLGGQIVGPITWVLVANGTPAPLAAA